MQGLIVSLVPSTAAKTAPFLQDPEEDIDRGDVIMEATSIKPAAAPKRPHTVQQGFTCKKARGPYTDVVILFSAALPPS